MKNEIPEFMFDDVQTKIWNLKKMITKKDVTLNEDQLFRINVFIKQLKEMKEGKK